MDRTVMGEVDRMEVREMAIRQCAEACRNTANSYRRDSVVATMGAHEALVAAAALDGMAQYFDDHLSTFFLPAPPEDDAGIGGR